MPMNTATPTVTTGAIRVGVLVDGQTRPEASSGSSPTEI